MTEEVTNLIAEARRFQSDGVMPDVNEPVWKLVKRLADALERSAAQTRGDAQSIRNAVDRWEVDGDDERLVNDVIDPWIIRTIGPVAVVPEDPKPDYWPKSLAEAKRILDAIRETSEPANTVFGPGEDNTPAYDWGRGLTISDGAEHREEGNREDLIDELAKAEDPKPLDPTPWFRWCDSEMPGAPAFERYARQSNGTEFKPREGYEQDESRYGVTPKAGA